MNFKELVDAIAAETQLPAGQVRKVSSALLDKFACLIESQTDFISHTIVLKAYTSPAKPATEGSSAKPERKLGRMRIRTKKPATSEAG